jgi:hypothetical protein
MHGLRSTIRTTPQGVTGGAQLGTPSLIGSGTYSG